MHARIIALWFKGDSGFGSLVPYLYDRYETFHVKMVSNNDGNLDYCWENILELLEHRAGWECLEHHFPKILKNRASALLDMQNVKLVQNMKTYIFVH